MASTSISMLGKTGNNAASDECYTPPEAVMPLLPYLRKDMRWYEATSGRSKSISSFMRSNGFDVTDALGDFFATDHGCDGVITNPPYSKKDKFISECYRQGLPFALLLPVSSFQGQKRGKMFAENGVDVLVLNQRVDFTGKGAPHFGVAWFTWGILSDRLIFADCNIS